MKFAAIILCGGQSLRMGLPKALLPWGDECFLQRSVRVLSEVLEPIAIVSAADQDLPELPVDIIIARDQQQAQGPLRGFADGLQVLADRVDAVYLSACDVPFVQPAFVTRMMELLGDSAIAIPEIGGRLHPLAAVYRVDVLPMALQLLANGQRRLLRLIENCSTRVVHANELIDVDPSFASVRNLNTLEEYQAAIQELEATANTCLIGDRRELKTVASLPSQSISPQARN